MRRVDVESHFIPFAAGNAHWCRAEVLDMLNIPSSSEVSLVVMKRMPQSY